MRRSTPYFQGKGICRHPGCIVEVTLVIHVGADELNDKVTVQYSANVHHDTSYISARHVSGQMRKELYEKLKHMNPSMYHHEKLNEMESDVYASGNRDSSTANVDVLRKIKSEIVIFIYVICNILFYQPIYYLCSNKNLRGVSTKLN